MDFIESLPRSNGFSVILVVVDRLTKYAHFAPVKHPYTTQQIAHIFFSNVVKLHGLPKSIMSDRDRVFTSHFWQELFKLVGTQLHLSSAYHPQSDGQTERVNQCLEMFLRCAVNDTPSQWVKWLDSAELWYNSCYHSSLKLSAFRDRGVPGPTSECRRVPQPRWVGARPSAKGGERWLESGVREVEIPRPSCSSRAQVGCACSRGLQASTRVRERAALRERLSRPCPRAANPL
jgi:hypothetical protein